MSKTDPINSRNGQDGFPGGNIVVRYVEADVTPILTSSGGKGGKKGEEDPKPGEPPVDPRYTIAAQPGKKDGDVGKPGNLINQQLDSAQNLWGTICQQSWAINWKDFICDAALYHFRCFTYQTRIQAIEGFTAVLGFDPYYSRANTYLQRAIHGQTPDGQSRDVDIAPDFKDLYMNISNFIGNVQSVFQSASQIAGDASILHSIQSSLDIGLVRTQADKTYAMHSRDIAKTDQDYAENRIIEIQNKINQTIAASSEFSFWNFVTTVGSIVSALVGIGTGIAAVISISDSMVAIGDLAYLSNNVKDFLNQKDLKKDLKYFGQSIKDFVGMKDGIYNFKNIIQQITDASSTSGQGTIGDLLRQLAEATW